MNINDLTIGQAKELNNLFSSESKKDKEIGERYLGQDVIVRTYSAGVWFGTLTEKSKNEVILKDARRLWRWKAAKSISLSAVAEYGICEDESKIAAPVNSVWLEAIEILGLNPAAIKSIKESKIVEAE